MIKQEEIYNALTSALPDYDIVKYVKDYDGKYPYVVYKEISNVPALHADNEEIQTRTTYQISIVTSNDEYSPLEEAIKKTMRSLDFRRVSSDDILDGDDYIRCIRFSYTGKTE